MFTIRVYGLLVHEGSILVSDELIQGRRITKFPGGGLEYGEGMKDCLIREIREEIGVEALQLQHFYTTDFFQQSSFHERPMQVVSVYYTFRVSDPQEIPTVDLAVEDITAERGRELFHWVQLQGDPECVLSLPIDRIVWQMLVER